MCLLPRDWLLYTSRQHLLGQSRVKWNLLGRWYLTRQSLRIAGVNLSDLSWRYVVQRDATPWGFWSTSSHHNSKAQVGDSEKLKCIPQVCDLFHLETSHVSDLRLDASALFQLNSLGMEFMKCNTLWHSGSYLFSTKPRKGAGNALRGDRSWRAYGIRLIDRLSSLDRHLASRIQWSRYSSKESLGICIGKQQGYRKHL